MLQYYIVYTECNTAITAAVLVAAAAAAVLSTGIRVLNFSELEAFVFIVICSSE
jgi:hypothetical protein